MDLLDWHRRFVVHPPVQFLELPNGGMEACGEHLYRKLCILHLHCSNGVPAFTPPRHLLSFHQEQHALDPAKGLFASQRSG